MIFGSALCLALGVALAADPAAAQTSDTIFPAPHRRVARTMAPDWGDEARRDRVGEAARVIDLLQIAPGVRVADIGAGSGYYTLRLARVLGPAAALVAEDVDAGYLADLRGRLDREGYLAVRTVLGRPDDPSLPAATVDLALLAHMYHEVTAPYAFLYRLRTVLAAGGRVVVVDLDRPIRDHGTPVALLRCEMSAAGFREVSLDWLVPADGYVAVFTPTIRTPDPATIEPCDE